MRRLGLAATLASALALSFGLAAGCRGPLVFHCTDDGSCVRGGKQGTCVTASAGVRVCAFADSTCAGGARFDPTAGSTLGGTCTSFTDGDAGMPDAGPTPDAAPMPDLLPAVQPDLQVVPITWAPLNSGVQEDFYGVGGSGPTDVYAISAANVYHSEDHGQTWVRRDTSAANPNDDTPVNVLAFASGEAFVVGWEGMILHSTNNGRNWTAQHSGTDDDLVDIWGTDPENIYVVGGDGAVLRSTNDGTTWKTLDTGINEDYNGVWGSGAADVFITGGDGTILHTVDSGQTFQVQSSGIGDYLFGVWGSGAGGDVYTLADKETILHASNGGGWSTQHIGGTDKDILFGVWGSSADDVYAVGTTGLILHTGDHGKTWVTQPSGVAAELNDVWGSGPDDIYAVGTNGVILHGTR